MVVRIMKKIPEARSASKLMASMAALNVKRAAGITMLLGGKEMLDKASAHRNGAKPEPAVDNAGKDGKADKDVNAAKDSKAGNAAEKPAPADAKGREAQKAKESGDRNAPKTEQKTEPKKDGAGKA
jgi:hypothetical protein